MKRTVVSVLLAALTASAFGDVEVTRQEASSIKSYDLEKFESVAHDSEGKIVKLKFNYRGSAVEKLDDGSISCSLRFWLPSRGNQPYKSGGVDAVVPPEGADWFLKIPTNDEKRSSVVVFARIEKGKYSGVVATLIGREIKTDSRGSRIVW